MQKIGNSSELLVAHYLASKGYDLFMPYGNSRADLIYERDSTLVKVQVKTGTKVKASNNEYEQVRLQTRGIYNVGAGTYRNAEAYSEGEVDELWVVGTHLWCFPESVFVGRPSLALGTSQHLRRRKTMNYNADDYVVVRGTWDRPFRDITCHFA